MPLDETLVDLLGDDRDLEQPIHVVEDRIRHLAAAGLLVALDDLAPVEVTGHGRGQQRQHLGFVRVRRVDPVAKGRAQFHQRVADGGHLPLEHREDAIQVRRIEHEVVVLEVPVDQRGSPLGRQVLAQPRRRLLDLWDLVGGHAPLLGGGSS